MEALRTLAMTFGTAVAGGALALDARAGDTDQQKFAPPAATAALAAGSEEAAGPWSLTLSAAAMNAYFFRCIPIEDRGAIVQPTFELDYLAHEGDGWLREASIGVGMFNSFHSGPTGTGGDNESPRAWYEADYFLTMNGKLEHGVELTVTWWEYTSPNSQFTSITELDAAVAWDDGYLWDGAFKIHPSVTLGRELRNQSEHPDNPVGTHPGTYLGVGIAPEVTLVDLGDPADEAKSRPLTLTFPVLLDLSLDHYYEDDLGHDETFGGAEFGAQFDVPLPFLGEGLGQWSFQAGAHYLVLGEHMKAQNGGDGSQWIVSGGISLTF